MAWGIINNNPFNIRPGDNWLGLVGEAGGFCKFIDMKHGIRAGLINLYNGYFSRGRTIKEIIAEYAPGSDNNNVESYAGRVSSFSGVGVDEIPGNDKWLKVAHGMMIVECGVNLKSEAQLREVVDEFNLYNYM